MFSYYGTKRKLAPLYPRPKFDTIIEPFAGAAAYSLLYPERNIILYDTNPKICAIWTYLKQASRSDILKLPDFQVGDKVTDYNLSPSERYLIGYCINPGSSTPKITASKRSAWNRYKQTIANDIDKIRHWTITQDSYDTIPDQPATWYIDPPYQKAGKYYFGYSSMDYSKLSKWCRSRSGQVIACENVGATYLPFRNLTSHRGSMRINKEVIWYRVNHASGGSV